MKKFLLLALLALPVTLFGQGTVTFANNSNMKITTNDLAGHTGNVATGYKIRVGLYIGTVGADPSTFSLVAVATNSGTTSGNFTYPGNPLAISGNNGTAIDYQVRAWTLSSGLDYETATALGTFKGVSGIGTVTPATGATPTPNLFAPSAGNPDYAGQLQSGFAITPVVPEPSSIALGFLGLGAVALFRRRK